MILTSLIGIFSLGSIIFLSYLIANKSTNLLRLVGISAGILIVGGFLFGSLNIPVRPLTYLIFCTAGSIALLAVHPRGTSRSLLPDSKPTINWLTIAVFIVSVLVGILYFRADFEYPQYYSLDAASHFLFAEHTQQTQQIQLFGQDLYFPDATGKNEYPFGTAVITATAFESIPFLLKDKVFQFLYVSFFAVINTYAFKIFTEKLNITNPIAVGLVILMQTLGYFFNLMSVGFLSQMTGLLLVLTFLDIYMDDKKKSSWTASLLLALIFSATFFTYYYWIAVLCGFLLIHNIPSIFAHQNRDRLVRYATFVGISAILCGYYIFRLIKGQSLQYATDDGTAYKVFLLNFILFVPLLIPGLIRSVKAVLQQKSAIHCFAITCIAFTAILYLLYRLDLVSSYTFTKSYYITGPILFFIALSELQHLGARLSGITGKLVLGSYAFTIVLIMGMMPFQRNVDCALQPAEPTVSFPMNTLSLDGRILDLYYTNIMSIVSPSFHRYNLDSERLEFISGVRSNLPTAYSDITKISVVTDYDTALWFYAKTKIWPRSLESGIYLFEPELADYAEWEKSDSTGLIVLIGSNETEQWKQQNGFDMNKFQTLYSVGDNYLLQKTN